MTPIKKEKSSKKPNRDSFLGFYEKSFCNISHACKSANISRQTFYNWKDTDEEFKERVIEIDESLLDFAESKLHDNIRNGRTAELIFYLKTKGKKRGYTEQYIEVENELPQGFELTDI